MKILLCARRLLWLILMVAIGPLGVAATPAAPGPLSIDQLDRLLSQLKGQSDSKAAEQLSKLTLTERVSTSQLKRWEETFRGLRMRKALDALTDSSAFLAPPAVSIPAIPPPDESARREILARMTAYAKQSAQMMPNFLALRSTTSFEIATESQLKTLQSMGQLFKKQQKNQAHYEDLGWAGNNGTPDAHLYWVGSASQTVAYRDGAEVADATSLSGGEAAKTSNVMTSVGEFGPMLPGLIEETSPDELIWDHWEDSSIGRLAVFRYSVPRDRSHFALMLSENSAPDFPAHHGEVSVDPESGVIFRITMIARVREPEGPREAGVAVEFGPTEIGGKSYICVVHGVAYAKFFSTFADLDNHPAPRPLQTTMNDVLFTDHRVFRTTSRIVPAAKTP